MNFEGLTPELQAKAEACKTPEEIIAVAQEAGYELSDAELEAISGGDMWDCVGNCPSYKKKPHCAGLSR